MKNIKKIVAVLLLALTVTACNQLSQIATQTAQAINLKNCTFNVNGINQIKMMGIDLSKGMNKSNLSAVQLLSVTNSLLNKKLPVTFNVNLDVNNPNGIAASLGKMDYIISLNNKEVICYACIITILRNYNKNVFSTSGAQPATYSCHLR